MSEPTVYATAKKCGVDRWNTMTPEEKEKTLTIYYERRRKEIVTQFAKELNTLKERYERDLASIPE